MPKDTGMGTLQIKKQNIHDLSNHPSGAFSYHRGACKWMENDCESGISLGPAGIDLVGGSYRINDNDSDGDQEEKGIEAVSSGEFPKTMFRWKTGYGK